MKHSSVMPYRFSFIQEYLTVRAEFVVVHDVEPGDCEDPHAGFPSSRPQVSVRGMLVPAAHDSDYLTCRT
jgi:hypothetical protein